MDGRGQARFMRWRSLLGRGVGDPSPGGWVATLPGRGLFASFTLWKRPGEVLEDSHFSGVRCRVGGGSGGHAGLVGGGGGLIVLDDLHVGLERLVVGDDAFEVVDADFKDSAAQVVEGVGVADLHGHGAEEREDAGGDDGGEGDPGPGGELGHGRGIG